MNTLKGMQTMTDIERLAAQSLSVWEEWNGQGVSARRALLGAWAENVSQRGGDFAKAAQMIRFHLQQAEALLEPVHDMPGPTGETNELYTAGRGLFFVTGDESLSLTGLAGQLAAALVAGNCVLAAIPKALRHETDALLADLLKASAPNRLVLTTEFEQLDDVLEQASICGVAAIASETRLIEINRILAAREGVLVQFVAESNGELLPLVASPTYLLRFITERTRTINITAVGGNATLLELGSGEH